MHSTSWPARARSNGAAWRPETPDGSYTYELDNTNPAVNKLDDGRSLKKKFSYTVADKDGSLSTADLVITINGYTDGKPQVVTSHVLGTMTPFKKAVPRPVRSSN